MGREIVVPLSSLVSLSVSPDGESLVIYIEDVKDKELERAIIQVLDKDYYIDKSDDSCYRADFVEGIRRRLRQHLESVPPEEELAPVIVSVMQRHYGVADSRICYPCGPGRVAVTHLWLC